MGASPVMAARNRSPSGTSDSLPREGPRRMMSGQIDPRRRRACTGRGIAVSGACAVNRGAVLRRRTGVPDAVGGEAGPTRRHPTDRGGGAALRGRIVPCRKEPHVPRPSAVAGASGRTARRFRGRPRRGPAGELLLSLGAVRPLPDTRPRCWRRRESRRTDTPQSGAIRTRPGRRVRRKRCRAAGFTFTPSSSAPR